MQHKIPDDPSIIPPIFEGLQESYKTRKALPLEYRKAQLKSLLKGFKEMRGELIESLKKDLGLNKHNAESFHLSYSDFEIRDCIKHLEKWNKPTQITTSLATGPAKSYVMPEPLGVVLIVGSWNFPYFLTIPYLATAITGGNCVIVKASELAPHSSKCIFKLINQYLDKDCYRAIEGQAEIAKKLVSLPFDKIVFTGITEKGKLVAKSAAENLTPCILELGGKSPLIVDKEIKKNVDLATLRIAQSRFTNSGQICVSNDYLFIHKDVKKEFLDNLLKNTDKHFAMRKDTLDNLGKIINKDHVKRLKSILDEKHGGKVLYGGRVDLENQIVEPTIIESPSFESRLMNEELFGPILPVQEFSDISEVINYLRNRPKPLTLYYYGNPSSKNFQKIKTQTSSGSISVNDNSIFTFNPTVPFGGVGNSGMGSVHGYEGFKQLVHMKPVTEKGFLNVFPYNTRYPPYNQLKYLVAKMVVINSHLNQEDMAKYLSAATTVGGIAYKVYKNRHLLNEFGDNTKNMNVLQKAKKAYNVLYGNPKL